MSYYCYILECANGAFYTGWTKDPLRRLKQHNSGSGARYTRLNGPTRLVYVEAVPDHPSALKREAQIKGWDHNKKQKFVAEGTGNILEELMQAADTGQGTGFRHFTVVAPGRVNLLGEHVDYNDGIVLPAAINREVRIEVVELSEPIVRLHARDMGERAAFSLENLANKQDVSGAPLPDFALYPAGVAWALQHAGLEVRGMEAEYTSSVPIGAGLSSSAAVEVGFALAWQILAGFELTKMELAQLCQKAENLYVGVNSGLMDQFASAFGVAGHALRFDTRSLEWEPVPVPAEAAIVIADSTVCRSLAGSAYNDRRRDCEEAVRLLGEHLPGLTSLRQVSPETLKQFLPLLPERVGKRAKHVVEEIARVEAACQMLAEGDVSAFGQLMNASHVSLRELYEVSCPELDALVEIATGLPGCLGARLTGAGFGGCTVNLVKQEGAQNFITALANQYQQKTGKTARIYLCQAAQGARQVA